MTRFITGFTIERLVCINTQYYMNPDQWSGDADDAEEFRTAGKAQRRADRVGGEVGMHQRHTGWPMTLNVVNGHVV